MMEDPFSPFNDPAGMIIITSGPSMILKRSRDSGAIYKRYNGVEGEFDWHRRILRKVDISCTIFRDVGMSNQDNNVK